MSKKKEETKELSVSLEDIAKYRVAISKLGKRIEGGISIPKYQQFLESVGALRIHQDGSATVTNVDLMSHWVRVRDSVEDYDAWKAEETRNLFPHEMEAHRKKLAGFSNEVRKIVLLKRV